MAITDVPPADCPPWLVPAHTVLLSIGVLFWDATYLLMTRRALSTKSYGMPLLALAINLSWELVTVLFVCETMLDTIGFFFWLFLDIGIVYTTVLFGPRDWEGTSPFVGRHIGWILGVMTAVAFVGNYTFTMWWLSAPGIGFGNKQGKWWRGTEGIDSSELTFWTAGVAQVVLSAGSIAMLVVRGHSGGTSYAIWFSRFMGTVFGLVLDNLLMWWYWPDGYIWLVHPFAVFLWGTSIACDMVYPFILYQIRRSEIQLPDGSLRRGDGSSMSVSDKKTR
ncbi:hypothetical protein V8F06_014124 [Rhypophila decipiens]